MQELLAQITGDRPRHVALPLGRRARGLGGGRSSPPSSSSASPNQYEASARIYVDTQSILKPLMSGLAMQPNIEQQIGMLSRTLISRPNLEKLVRMADLDLGSSSKAQQDKL